MMMMETILDRRTDIVAKITLDVRNTYTPATEQKDDIHE